MPDLPCTMHENLLGEIKEAKVNEGPHPTSLRSATFPIGEGKAVERLRSKPAFPSGEGARRADEVFVHLISLLRDKDTQKQAVRMTWQPIICYLLLIASR